MSRHAQIAVIAGTASGFIYLILAFESASKGEFDSTAIWGLAGFSLFISGFLAATDKRRGKRCPAQDDASPQ